MTTGLFCNAEVDWPEPEGVADPEGVPEPKRAGAVTLSNHNLDLFKCEQETTTAGLHNEPLFYQQISRKLNCNHRLHNN